MEPPCDRDCHLLLDCFSYGIQCWADEDYVVTMALPYYLLTY